ncbi:hypothetical protein BDZ85DRAFT_11771 [Elsinoe ampelina]|uniref:Uncharacterized protein n=1 Tax=Elsinoe ampelina TaxID=302913 RepID=A0A6A6GQW8_9PEZI|nr:hypothetical protein BDZ85DRAFT_11771 [Elsinoe ampelina]
MRVASEYSRKRSDATLHSLRVVPRLPRRLVHFQDGQYHQHFCFIIVRGRSPESPVPHGSTTTIYTPSTRQTPSSGAGVVQMALSPTASSLRDRENNSLSEAWSNVEAWALHKAAPKDARRMNKEQ